MSTLNEKKMLTNLSERYAEDSFQNAAVTISSGTIGTYATYQTIDVSKTGYRPISVSAQFAHSGTYLPLVFLQRDTELVFINFYRVQSAAYSVPAGDVKITVFYEKE